MSTSARPSASVRVGTPALVAVLACLCLPVLTGGPRAQGAIDVAKLKAIVTAPDPAPLEQQAAAELGKYLKKMYGVELPVQARGDIGPKTRNVILLGAKAVQAAGAITADELRKVQWDGYVIKARTGRVALAGPRSRATLFAVSGLLEHLGARFYGVTETIPSLKGKPIKEFTLSDKPVFEYRRGHQWTLKTNSADLADPRKGATPELFTKAAGSNLWLDHTAGYLVPIDLYFDKHPEYYALVRGKRIACGRGKLSDRDVVLCLSNPDVIRISTERMLAWMDKNPEQRFFCMTYGDTGTFCQCAQCKKLDPVPGQYADRLLHWINPVARAVAKKHPDKALLALAYLNYQEAPKRLKPESNVIVLYTPWWGLSTLCRRHPYSMCFRSVIAARQMEDWLKWAPGSLGVYDYALNADLPGTMARRRVSCASMLAPRRAIFALDSQSLLRSYPW